MLDIKAATTEQLQEFVRHDIETRTDESDTDFLLKVLEELHRRGKESGRKITPKNETWKFLP